MVKKSVEVDQAVLMQKVEYISKAIDEMKKTLEEMPSHFVSQEEWTPVKNVVYGVVGLLLTSVVVAITALVVHK
jgi:ABC-type phosphate transport system permease subunit